MDALGINIFNIVVYTVLFVILYVVLKKYLAKPVMDMLEKRAAAVAKVQADREEIAAKMDDLEKTKAKLTEKMQQELKEEREKSLADAKAEKQKIVSAAKKEAEIIVAKANQKLEQERKQQEEQLAEKIEQATLIVLKEVYNTDKTSIDKKLIQKALQELS